MRVTGQQRRNDNPPFAISFSSLKSFVDEEGEQMPFESILSDELLPQQQASNVSGTFSSSIWNHILPGLERGCIILRSQEYSHSEIAWIFGMKTDEVSRVLYKVKNRLVKLGVKQNLDMPKM